MSEKYEEFKDDAAPAGIEAVEEDKREDSIIVEEALRADAASAHPIQGGDPIRRANSISFQNANQEANAQQLGQNLIKLLKHLLTIGFFISLIYIVDGIDNLKEQYSLNQKEWLRTLYLYFTYQETINLLHSAFNLFISPRINGNLRNLISGIFGLSLGSIASVLMYKFGESFFINYGIPKPPESESTFLTLLFRCCQVFGTFYLLFISCLCLGLCVIIATHFRAQQAGNEMRGTLLQRLKAMPYANAFFQEGQECSICMENFKPDDQVVQLKCYVSHIFHQSCIEDWIKQGVDPKCPLCKQPIEYS